MQESETLAVHEGPLDTRRDSSTRKHRRLAFLVPLALFGGLAAVLGVGLSRDPHEVPSPLIGKRVPETFLIGADGRIAYKHIGPLTAEFVRDKLLPMIETLRKQAPIDRTKTRADP